MTRPSSKVIVEESKAMTKPQDRVLDWKSEHDDRSKNFKMTSILPQRIDVQPMFWQEGPVLDQGTEGACVGFGWMAELLAEPNTPEVEPTVASAQETAFSYYKRAQKIDAWDGEDYSGTSVLAGAKIVKEEGFIDGYRWCFGVEDVKRTILCAGPIVIGVPWTTEMYETEENGLVKLGGEQVGGHCLVITGYHPEMHIGGNFEEVFRWRNSWGEDYGIGGSAYIKYDDLRYLLSQGGEACVPIGRSTPTFD